MVSDTQEGVFPSLLGKNLYFFLYSVLLWNSLSNKGTLPLAVSTRKGRSSSRLGQVSVRWVPKLPLQSPEMMTMKNNANALLKQMKLFHEGGGLGMGKGMIQCPQHKHLVLSHMVHSIPLGLHLPLQKKDLSTVIHLSNPCGCPGATPVWL